MSYTLKSDCLKTLPKKGIYVSSSILILPMRMTKRYEKLIALCIYFLSKNTKEEMGLSLPV